MTRKTVRETYFDYLYAKITMRRTYHKLCRTLHKIPFTWSVPNDDNRLEDGLELRRRFIDDSNIDTNHVEVSYFSREECSVFEMLVGLSVRLDGIMAKAGAENEDAGRWFFELLRNLHLEVYSDNFSYEQELPDKAISDISQTIERMVNRTYTASGVGSLFPMKRTPKEDFRKVEIWYQMMQYLMENYNY